MHIIKITPNLIFEYQCTSGKLNLSNWRIESKKIDSVARIESKLFCRNWNALVGRTKCLSCIIYGDTIYRSV